MKKFVPFGFFKKQVQLLQHLGCANPSLRNNYQTLIKSKGAAQKFIVYAEFISHVLRSSTVLGTLQCKIKFADFLSVKDYHLAWIFSVAGLRTPFDYLNCNGSVYSIKITDPSSNQQSVSKNTHPSIPKPSLVDKTPSWPVLESCHRRIPCTVAQLVLTAEIPGSTFIIPTPQLPRSWPYNCKARCTISISSLIQDSSKGDPLTESRQ